MSSWTGNLAILWAKLGRNAARTAPRYHPLLCHMLDVAVVTRALWQSVLAAPARQHVAYALGLDVDATRAWMAFWAGLHDIGKACPAFQHRSDAPTAVASERLARAGLRPSMFTGSAPHGTVTTSVLPAILQSHFSIAGDVACRVATSIGGHHGTFPRSADVEKLLTDAIGVGCWQEVRIALAERLAYLLGLPRGTCPRDLDNTTAMWLAGLVSVADWIGSDDTFFPYRVADAIEVPELDWAAYHQEATASAERALRELGWLGPLPPHETQPLRTLFPYVTTPTPVQTAVVSLAERLHGPGLVIVEAPMGEGKTEAAMYLADHCSATTKQRGCYFALPTQATSNQMFGRIKGFLERRYPDESVNLQLLHGHAALSTEFLQLLVHGDPELAPRNIYGDGGTAQSSVIAAEWFTYRKRGSLAPFGVGTVDQALLAVLATRHVFVRVFGLAHKTVIVDEVHAYDTYMSTLLKRLLEWLGATRTTTILLSATLPAESKAELEEAYMRGAWYPGPPPTTVPYPRVSWVTAADAGAMAIGVSPHNTRTLRLEWVDSALPVAAGEPFALAQQLQGALALGGCAAVICNTVGRAQQVYRGLKPYFPGEADDELPLLDLFHARYPFEERDRREKRVLARFGKPGSGPRPHRAILVATQVVEQSLDLDFDLLVTDMAPVDLVLQRAGRLQRHERERPPGMEEPVLWLCLPETVADGVPRFDRGTAKVYDAHTLLRSWLALCDRTAVAIPSDVERLIEAVYGSQPCPQTLPSTVRDAWERTWQELRRAKEHDEEQAKRRYIRRPGYTGELWRVVGETREEDAPELHQAHQALTRLAEPSVAVICLFGTPEQPYLDGALRQRVHLQRKPSMEEIRSLLLRSMTITDKRIVFTLMGQEAPKGWQESPLLRQYRVLALDEKGETMVGRFRVRLDGELGLLIGEEEGE